MDILDMRDMSKEDIAKILQSRINHQMHEKHLSQADIARRTGINQDRLSKCISEVNEAPSLLTVPQLIKIASALNCSIEDLVLGERNRTEPKNIETLADVLECILNLLEVSPKFHLSKITIDNPYDISATYPCIYFDNCKIENALDEYRTLLSSFNPYMQQKMLRLWKKDTLNRFSSVPITECNEVTEELPFN